MRHDLAKLNTLELYLFIALCYVVKAYCCVKARLRWLPFWNRRKSTRLVYPNRRRAALARYRWGHFFDSPSDDHTMETQP